jgi:FAD/FMN-containing dehydrogenase
VLHLKKIGDKQKIFKLALEYAKIVHGVGGVAAGGQAEGRVNAFASYPLLEESVIALNESIRKVFDPFGTLNPGVKQKNDVKILARQLRES